MPNKAYLLQLARTLNLVAALTSAFIAVQPLLTSNPNWTQIVVAFVVSLGFAMAHSGVSHIQDGNLRTAIGVDLATIMRMIAPSKEPQPITLPDNQPPRG